MHEAMYYEKQEGRRVICHLCPHHCHLGDGQLGICQVRENHNGTLYSLNYGQCSGFALDPIEKKPLKQFHPGSSILSVGSFGCNFRCSYCQNWSISQERPRTKEITPGELADLAVKYRNREPDCIGVAYTYSEPMMWYEYVLNSAKEVKQRGLVNVLVTNGYIETEPLRQLVPYIDAVNLDIKAYTEDFYRKICRGSLGHVLHNAKIMAEHCHLEVTTLLIPGHNDDVGEIGKLAKFLADIDDNIILHLTRYFPNYKMDLPPTSLDVMEDAYQAAKQYLQFVYLGNV